MFEDAVVVDFAVLIRRHYDSLDAAGRARIDAMRLAEAEAARTEEAMDAVFTTLERRTGRVLNTETRPVRVRIERKRDEDTELLVFNGAVTGYERYTLDPSFVHDLVRAAEGDGARFVLCAGTPGAYDSCTVAIPDVLAYLGRWRPDLIEAPSAGPVPN